MNISHHAPIMLRKVTLQAQTAHLASVKTLSEKQVFFESCASLKFKQQQWPDLGLEDVDRQGVDPKAADHALEIYRKMIDKVRQKAAAEEKKKDDDLKKKEEVSKKTRGRKAWKSFGLSCKKGHQGRAK